MVTNNHHEEKEDEKKNKRRGLLIAFLVHIGVLILALIPWITPEPPEVPKEVYIAFEDIPPPPPEPEIEEIPFEDSGSSNPDDPIGDTQDAMEQEAAPDTPDEPDPEPTPEPTPDPVPDPAPETPAPVATSPEEAPISAPEVTEPVKPTKPTPPTDIPSKPTKPTKPTRPGSGADANTSTDSGNTAGKPGTATGTDNGTSAGAGGSGGNDTGTGSGDGSGHGFNRKVTDRPKQWEIKAIAQGKVGKVYVDVCINQMGKVVSADANKGKSTIKDNTILQKAEYLAKKYRFEKDFKAPTKQCWYLVFNFKEDNGNAKAMPESYDTFIFIE